MRFHVTNPVGNAVAATYFEHGIEADDFEDAVVLAIEILEEAAYEIIGFRSELEAFSLVGKSWAGTCEVAFATVTAAPLTPLLSAMN